MADPAKKPTAAGGKEPSQTPDHPENQEGAAKATDDNDLTTGHSEAGDGGDANSKNKKT